MNEFTLLEAAGFSSAILGMRYPTKSMARSDSRVDETGRFILGEADARLATSLISKGQEHAKFQRGIVVWFHINLPRYAWQELDTYTVGTLPVSSESTMYTLKREISRGLITCEAFSPETSGCVIEACQMMIAHLVTKYGELDNVPQDVLKGALPESWMQARVRAFTYQTLGRIHQQRHNHRLPFWRETIIPAIEQLPYADQLIFGKNR